MILGAIVLGALLLLAFAGRALGDPADDNTPHAGGWEALLFVALLLGIVLKHKRARDAEDEL